MVILRTRNKITDFLMILAWASPFKSNFQLLEVVDRSSEEQLQVGKTIKELSG